MEEKISRNKERLQDICYSKNKSSLIQTASKEVISIICDCVLNILKNNIQIDEQGFKKLYPYRKQLRELIIFGTLKQKKLQIVQIQKILPVILNEVC